MLANLFLQCFLMLLVGCKEKPSYNDVKDIYSIVIDKTIIIRPIPPPLQKNETLISKQVLDSLKRISLDVAIYKINYPIISDFKNIIVDDEYKSITKALFTDKNNNLHVSEKNIGSFIGHKLTIISEDLIQNKTLLFKDFHQVVSLSRISFNKENNKAVVYVVTSLSGKLSGYTYLFLLKKVNEKWGIDTKKELSIS